MEKAWDGQVRLGYTIMELEGAYHFIFDSVNGRIKVANLGCIFTLT